MKTRHRVFALLCTVTLLFACAMLLVSAVKPDYQTSAAYQTSLFYDNLLSLELTGDGRADVLQVALSQLGYHEGNSDKDLDGMNKSGSRNFVEYNVRYGKLDNGEGNGVSYGYMWCAAFVNWCLRQARVDESLVGGMYVSCQSWLAWFKKAGRYQSRASGYEPQPGDLIFFKSNRTQAASNHIGFVVYTENGKVHTVEGNSEEVVGFHEYALSDTYIVGYGVPDYKTVDGMEYELLPGCTDPGYYSLQWTRSVPMWADFTNRTQSVANIPQNSAVYVCATYGEYAYVRFGEQYGWVALSRLYPILRVANGTTVLYCKDDGAPTVVRFEAGKTPMASATAPQTDDSEAAFLGWSTQKDAETATYSAGSVLPENTVLTLYAVFTKKQHTAVFEGLDGKTLATVTGSAGSELHAPTVSDVVRDGVRYTFRAWEPSVPETLTADGVYRAVFEEQAVGTADGTTGTLPADAPENTGGTTVQSTGAGARTTAETPEKTGCSGSVGVLITLLCLPAAGLLFRRKEQ